jgi:hypothetical protein
VRGVADNAPMREDVSLFCDYLWMLVYMFLFFQIYYLGCCVEFPYNQ